MKNHLFIFFVFAFSSPLFSQNLILNPSFENKVRQLSYKPCEYTRHQGSFDRRTDHWNTFSGLTPELITYDSTNTTCRFTKPHSGTQMAGLILYHPREDIGYDYDYHESIMGTLRQPLIPGKRYEISFWVQQNDSIAIDHLHTIYGRRLPVYAGACSNLSILFSTTKIYPEQNIRTMLRDFEMKPQIVFKEIIETNGKWVKMTADFVPNQAFEFFIVGNFESDINTETTIKDSDKIRAYNQTVRGGFWAKKKRISYYLFDDFDLRLATEKVAIDMPEPSSIAETFAKATTYTFQNVLFQSGKAKLQHGSFAELDDLVVFLNKNPQKKIEIGGHTDNVGKDVQNQLLSGARAKAVYNYLVEKGVDETRLTFKGYGETQPKVDNYTEANRAINRRVEVRILEQTD